jgi:hypothetical protein
VNEFSTEEAFKGHESAGSNHKGDELTDQLVECTEIFAVEPADAPAVALALRAIRLRWVI